MSQLKHIKIDHFELASGLNFSLKLSYQHFGQPLNSAPVVLVNHALTGNSQVVGKDGWWNGIIGANKVIDTNCYSVLAFNTPGNGYGNNVEDFTKLYKDFTAKDIARIFIEGLQQLNINKLFAVIGGSVGGGIAWELACLRPNLIENLIPIATDWKATDWLIANCYVQERILENSRNPIVDARIHAMTFYRNSESFKDKFNRTKASALLFNVESWLNHHGEKLAQRFQLSAYKMMNQILKTINVAENETEFLTKAKKIRGNIYIITVNSDVFFVPDENWDTYVNLKTVKDNVSISEIKSIHGHDAFLIDFQQLAKFLKPIFNKTKTDNDTSQLSYIGQR